MRRSEGKLRMHVLDADSQDVLLILLSSKSQDLSLNRQRLAEFDNRE